MRQNIFSIPFYWTTFPYFRILHQLVLSACSRKALFNVQEDLLDITLTSNPVVRYTTKLHAVLDKYLQRAIFFFFQLYHMCDGLGRQFSYSCPNTTLFQQRMLVCDHWYMVNCSKAESNYNANLLIGNLLKWMNEWMN